MTKKTIGISLYWVLRELLSKGYIDRQGQGADVSLNWALRRLTQTGFKITTEYADGKTADYGSRVGAKPIARYHLAYTPIKRVHEYGQSKQDLFERKLWAGEIAYIADFGISRQSAINRASRVRKALLAKDIGTVATIRDGGRVIGYHIVKFAKQAMV